MLSANRARVTNAVNPKRFLKYSQEFVYRLTSSHRLKLLSSLLIPSPDAASTSSVLFTLKWDATAPDGAKITVVNIFPMSFDPSAVSGDLDPTASPLSCEAETQSIATSPSFRVARVDSGKMCDANSVGVVFSFRFGVQEPGAAQRGTNEIMALTGFGTMQNVAVEIGRNVWDVAFQQDIARKVATYGLCVEHSRDRGLKCSPACYKHTVYEDMRCSPVHLTRIYGKQLHLKNYLKFDAPGYLDYILYPLLRSYYALLRVPPHFRICLAVFLVSALLCYFFYLLLKFAL